MNTVARAEPKLTINQFLAAYAGREEKFELIDGTPQLMAGANRRHVRIMGNLLWRLKERLQGGPCETLAADMGIGVSQFTYRLPDIAIYCDPRDLGPRDVEPMMLHYPRVIFEILSPSTETTDHGIKLDEYQGIESVDTIVFVHPLREAFTTFERASANEWRTVVHLPGQPLILRDPQVTIAAAEIFAGVR